MRSSSSATHCARGHEFTEENTYRPPGHPERRLCRTCKKLVAARYRREGGAESDEPNTLEVDGVTLTMSAEVPDGGPTLEAPPRYLASYRGTDLGDVYRLTLLVGIPTWFARHPGEEPTGPYPDILAALRGLIST